MAHLKCIVVTPDATVLDEPADFVALALFDGEIGIGADHSPMIGRLGAGEMRIRQEDTVRRYYIEGGFVEVLDNEVSVLTNRAIPSEKLDMAILQEQLRETRERPANTPELVAIRDRAVAQIRAQLRVARRMEE